MSLSPCQKHDMVGKKKFQSQFENLNTTSERNISKYHIATSHDDYFRALTKH